MSSYITNLTKGGSIRKMKIPCMAASSDRVAIVYFDIEGWFEKTTQHRIKKLFEEGLGPGEETKKILKSYDHPGINVMNEYIYAVAPFKRVKCECWISTIRATKWVKANRSVLYNLLLKDEQTAAIINSKKDHVQFSLQLS